MVFAKLSYISTQRQPSFLDAHILLRCLQTDVVSGLGFKSDEQPLFDGALFGKGCVDAAGAVGGFNFKRIVIFAMAAITMMIRWL